MCCVPLKVLQLQTSTAPPPTAPRIITSTSAPKTTAATKPELRSATVASITRAPAPAPAVTKVRDLAYTCGTSNVVHGAPTPAMRGEEAPLGNPETHGPQSSAFYSIGLHRLRRNDCFPTEIVDNLTRSYRTLFLDGCNYHFSFYSIYEKKGGWPWLVLLGYRTATTGRISYQCSGVLVTNQHVVAAAHCLYRRSKL